MKTVSLDLLLSTQVGLLGSIVPSLRAVTVGFDEEAFEIYLRFFFDEKISDELFELMTVASIGIHPEEKYCHLFYGLDEVAVELNYPNPVPVVGGLAYLRREQGMPLPVINFLPCIDCPTEPYLAYTLQQGLLGRVIPSLRNVRIGVDDKNKICKFYFYYEEEISKEISQLSREAIAIAAQAFSMEYKTEEVIECLPWPARIPDVGGRVVFERKEEIPPWAY